MPGMVLHLKFLQYYYHVIFQILKFLQISIQKVIYLVCKRTCFTVPAAMECHWQIIVPMWSIKWKHKKQSYINPTEVFGFEITISQCYSEKCYTFGLSKYCSVNYWTSQMNSSTHIFEKFKLGLFKPHFIQC